MTSPQASQCNTRAERGSFTRQAEQIFEDGYHLDATHSAEPYQEHL